MRGLLPWTLAACAAVACAGHRGASAADLPEDAFCRGVNFNGPAVTIDGNLWEAGDAAHFECADSAFENQGVELVPPTDAERARMIRSSVWSPEGRNRVLLTAFESGRYRVFLYVWEDNDTQTFDVFLNGSPVQQGVLSGAAGEWRKLGPWDVEVSDGSIELASRGGHANFSGVEVWRAAADRPPVDPQASRAFDSKVAPVLAARCLSCHNPADHKGELDLTTYRGAMAGGSSGPVLAAGPADESLLWRRVAAEEMPPDAPLPPAEKETLHDWIASGAAWGMARIDPFRFTTGKRAGYDWWSLQPIRRPEPPVVRNAGWPANDIDRFVLAKLEAAGLEPAAEADRRTQIRRLYFDCLGLPPEPDDVEQFVADPSPDAYSALVDRLLDSPQFGVRWARHWLDVVRFGESQGFERNKLRPNAWRYRDWVVEAFNSDLPYDEFVRLQLVGDVLRPDDPLAVVASGFLVMGPYDQTAYTDGTPNMRAAAREEELEGLVGTVAQSFLGLTINCARCHDHKFDPVTQKEYYQVASALYGTYHGDERETLSEAGKAAASAAAASLNAEIEALRNSQAAEADAGRQADLRQAVSRKESVARLLAGGLAHISAPQEPGIVRVLARGDFRQPRESVAASGVAAVAGPAADWKLSVDAPEALRRKALAEWIADSANPLAPRVIVNRLWGHYFGAGLVATPNDFGFNGGRPSHPELLDYLASELVAPQAGPARGRPWSLKHLHRLILNSAAYREASNWQSSSGPAAEALANDADNRLLGRHAPQRRDAEALRDAVLAVSGDLDPSLGGPGFRDFTAHSSSENQIYEVFDATGPEFNRRSLYRTWIRTGTNPFLDAFDCPDPSVSTPRRVATTTPLQALSLLNSGFMERGARAWAARLEQAVPDSAAKRIELAYRQAFGRPPTGEETVFGERFIGEHGLWQYCLVLFNTSEFVYIE